MNTAIVSRLEELITVAEAGRAVAQSPALGARLRHRRHAAGMKQELLARRSGLCRSSIAAIEAGHRGKRPSPSTLQRLAAALGLTVAELVETPVVQKAQQF